ncbi:MAG: hypothetical protein AB1595_03360, partial [bacterium]
IQTKLTGLDEATLKYIIGLIPKDKEISKEELVKRVIEETEKQKREIKEKAENLTEKIEGRAQTIMEKLM